jgi:hypothetical protein
MLEMCKGRQRHYAMFRTFNDQSTLRFKIYGEGTETYQKPDRLSARYSGPNKAGLLLYRSNSCILVQMV